MHCAHVPVMHMQAASSCCTTSADYVSSAFPVTEFTSSCSAQWPEPHLVLLLRSIEVRTTTILLHCHTMRPCSHTLGMWHPASMSV